ncbi:sugar phosphate isomerase/epimerase [Litorilinea aerophila]|uniref:Sugar phosphate isomerase/epimerase n=1 Tax=Litorilinea aerophila TaxID=1204385 RepID=A0A540VA73_9CHLR|nr:TIM barrel protein [Litorilinea aerophila]MCC9078525.1 sugar phosphate isomerase/epimerase [Litorilinea aerophila]OUC05569.1 hypothetical protein RY27_26465 [Litorilinea aerophila]
MTETTSPLLPGLVSITFRQLTPAAIVELVAQAGLAGIEWGGDVHVPHGDLARAREVRRLTAAAGLQVAAYGSYYRVGHDETGPFDAVLATAVELEAPRIRVWAGRQGTDTADSAYWRLVIEDSLRIAELAAAAGIPIVYEFHRNTLTDTSEAARRLLQEVAHPNVGTYWQPPRGSMVAENLAGLELLAPWLRGLHVFSWHEQSGQRLPLAERADAWLQYLARAAALDRPMFALLEFVQEDEPAHFLRDAATLKGWLEQLDMAAGSG